MAAWRVAKSLDTLRAEIDAAAPERSTVSDGAMGDARHQKTKSDHVPCACCTVVCARDVTHDPAAGFDSYAFAEWLRVRVAAADEPRVRYVISDGRIYSGQGQRYPAGLWRAYTGTNRHAHHVHVSVRHGAEYYDDPAPWGWPERTTP